jgi:O-antigen/teichoic acid export membrane protein
VVLAVLAAGTLLNALTAVPTVTSLGVGEAWMPAAFAFGTSVLNLAANFLLIPRYGINGAAFALLIPTAIVGPLFFYVVTRMIKFSIWELFTHGLLRPLVCASAQFAFLVVFRRYVHNLLTLGLLCALSLCIFGVLSFFGAITREERSALLRTPTVQVSEG